MVCAERTKRSKIVLTHRMKLLGDLAHLESRFGPFGDAVSVGARLHGLRRMYHRLRYHFGRTQWYS
jgi:hypothetical protein